MAVATPFVGAPLIGAPPAAAVDDGVNPRRAWVPASTSPALVFPQSGDTNDQRMFPSLLPAGSLLGSAALDAWYLWLWTHDSSRIHLYTAPMPAGPWTDQGYSLPPTPYPAGYVAGHFSSGDVVWDPDGHRFVSTPHGLRTSRTIGNAEACQDSFLIESTDGRTWQWLDGDNSPRLVCGPPQSVDSVHTGYGRLLRDLDGNLFRFQGRTWWLYRAQRHDVGTPNVPNPTQYTPQLVSSATLGGPYTAKQPAFTTISNGLGLTDVGSFLRGAREHHVLYAEGSPLGPPTAAFANSTGADDMAFLPRSQLAIAAPPSAGAVASAGISVARDPISGTQYGAQIAVNLVSNEHELWIYEGVPG